MVSPSTSTSKRKASSPPKITTTRTTSSLANLPSNDKGLSSENPIESPKNPTTKKTSNPAAHKKTKVEDGPTTSGVKPASESKPTTYESTRSHLLGLLAFKMGTVAVKMADIQVRVEEVRGGEERRAKDGWSEATAKRQRSDSESKIPPSY